MQRLENISNRQVLAVLIAVVILLTVFSALVNPEGYTRAWLSGLLQNLSTEIMGALVTFAVFDRLIAYRERQEEKEQERYEQQLEKEKDSFHQQRTLERTLRKEREWERRNNRHNRRWFR